MLFPDLYLAIEKERMVKLSVTIITYNEERYIGQCLESVKDIADEIIVVDSLSTDATKEICLRYNVSFIAQPFLGYVEQKNFALVQASNQYVLSMDADEALNPELKTSILNEKEKGFPMDGYTMNRLNFYCGKWIRHGIYYPDRKLRLLNKGKGQWGGRNPHDTIVMQKDSSVGWLKGDLLHYIFQSDEEHIQKMRVFSRIAAESLYKENKSKNKAYLKVIFGPVWAFIKSYIVKRGFLDGRQGWLIAKNDAFYVFSKYKKLIQLYRLNT
jgi:glycosyltransferase involved in cell wall biosynthesis